jgi:hypothetical protein
MVSNLASPQTFRRTGYAMILFSGLIGLPLFSG